MARRKAIMKKVFYILVTVALIIAAYFFYENYEFNKYINNPPKSDMNIPINEQAPVQSKGRVEISAPISTVWKILTGIDKWPGWQKSVTKTTIHGEIKEAAQFEWKSDGLSFKSRVHTMVPESKFGWTGTTLGAYAIHNWFFESNGNKTIVRVEESLQGVFPRLFKNYFQKNLDSGILKNMNELKAASEKK